MKRTIALAALTLLALTSTTAASAAGDSKDACKNGGYVAYVDPATGQPFADQGACVSFVAEGGELVPVAPPVVEIRGARFNAPGGSFEYHLYLSGFPASSPVKITYYIPVPSTGVPVVDVWTTETDINGELLLPYYASGGTCTDPIVMRFEATGVDLTVTPHPAICDAV